MIHNSILQYDPILKKINAKKKLFLKKRPVVRFSFFPSGPMHLGHAYICIINAVISYLNNGKFYFIVDDTNPKKIDKKAYDYLLEDLQWLGIIPDKIFYTSDYIEQIYIKIYELIKDDKAYLCNCKYQHQNFECRHENNPTDINIERFNNLLNLNNTNYSVQVRWPKEIDKYFSSRTILRYVSEEHPRKPEFKIWPTMNFAVPFMDKFIGTTDIIRGPDHIKNTPRQKYIHHILESQPITFTYGSKISSMKGPSRTSIIKKEISKGSLNGFDDPRVFTLQSFRKRGILPQAIFSYVLSLKTPKYSSLKSNSIFYSEEQLAAENRLFLKLMEISITKCTYLINPIKIIYKKGKLENEIYISQNDFEHHMKGDLIILKNEGICQINGSSIIYIGQYHEKLPYIYWLHVKENFIQANMRNGTLNNIPQFTQGIITKKDYKVGEMIFINDIGHCRINSLDPLNFIFSHK